MAFSGAFDRRLRPALNALDETSRMVGNINSGIQASQNRNWIAPPSAAAALRALPPAPHGRLPLPIS